MAGGEPAGGSAELAELIDQYGEHLVPDLKREYGIDLRDLFSEENPLSPRWVLVHARSLKMDSAFVAEVRGGQHFRGWDPERYMLANIIDLLRALLYAIVMAYSDPKKGKPKPPQPYPLPDYRDAKQKQTSKPNAFSTIAAQLIAAKRRKKEARQWQEQAETASRSVGSSSR